MQDIKIVVARLGILMLVVAAFFYHRDLQYVAEGALALLERSTAQASVAAPPERYRIAPVKRGDVHQTVTAMGTLNAVVTVEVGTQLSGQLAKVHVDFNDEVKAGQPLAELD